MFEIKRSMFIETAHLLRDHPGACSNIHGHSYKVSVIIQTEQLINDMVMDFTDLKNIMNEVIGHFDHALVIDHVTMRYLGVNGLRVVTMSERPTAENMAKYFFNNIQSKIPLPIKLKKVIVRETENNEASFSE